MKRSPIHHKTPIKRQSKKRKAENVVYLKLRQRFLEERPVCEWALCYNRSTDVHHTAGTVKNYLNTKTWRAMCRRCHQWLTDNGKVARKLGWLKT